MCSGFMLFFKQFNLLYRVKIKSEKIIMTVQKLHKIAKWLITCLIVIYSIAISLKLFVCF